ncbi:MAG: hypothetical protein JOY83_11405 [Alphaproteobacteria bacterium]|nr:hypothetical protein [Alphaproteobacteria bacterium]
MLMTIEESDHILARLPPPPYGIDEWMIACNVASYHTSENGYDRFTGRTVRVGPWPDTYNWSDAYDITEGCCFSAWHKLRTTEEKMEEIFRGFFNFVLGKGINPEALHRELCKIRGYLGYVGRAGFSIGTFNFFQRGRLSPYNSDDVVDPYGPAHT